MNQELVLKAAKNISDILEFSIRYTEENTALVVFDKLGGLAEILTEAYRLVLPNARFVDFGELDKEGVLAEFSVLKGDDLVVLIQTSNFRLDDFRIRLHLFEKKLKVIEHMHLYRNDEINWDVYVNSLEFDRHWYGEMGPKLQSVLSKTNGLKIVSGDSELTAGKLEIPKLNTGDYTGMDNVGGTFPIGEVFTEAQDLSTLNGTINIYAFANKDFTINFHEPFAVHIQNGEVVGFGENAPEDFKEIVRVVSSYERPVIREIGFGLNRAITRERHLGDITAFERILGMHMSLGEKHSVYKKAGISKSKSKFHVDLFLALDNVICDDQRIFEDGKYTF
jgi:aminopeptidase